jgi:hypothetical protein
VSNTRTQEKKEEEAFAVSCTWKRQSFSQGVQSQPDEVCKSQDNPSQTATNFFFHIARGTRSAELA